MTIDPWVSQLFPVFLPLIGLVAWHIRGEAKGLANEKALVDALRQIDKLDTQLRALDNRIVEKLSFIERSLAKIEGQLIKDNHGGN